MSRETAASEKKGDIFIVSAPSGAGKTTLCHELLRKLPNLRHSVSYTTRPPRRGEVDKVHYHFVTKKRFMKMIENNEFAEWAMVHGNLYGTAIKKLEESNNKGYDIILDIDIQGAAQMRRRFRDAYYIFILPPSGKALKERLSGRKSDSREEIKKRLERAIDEMASYNKYDYIIINDKLADALKELESIIVSSRLRIKRADLGRINKITK
ncbi:MAG: guanylate kinase [Nitrospirae bacterium]|nr:guanylate kinase [Nitrospirota bacterium]